MTQLRRRQLWRLVVALAGVPLMVYAFSSGPPSEHTGGFGEPTCTECHLGNGVNTGPGSVTITAPSTYSSGQTYQITVRVADPQRTIPSQSRWGFELSARTQGGQQAGNLAPTNNQTQLAPTFNGIQYIAHTIVGTRPGTTLGVNFTFNWTAPNASAGPVVMHAAGNAANNSQTELGDRIYSTSLTVQPPPAVFSGGVVNNASFAPDPAPTAPGSIAAIFGTNLNNGSQNPSSGFGQDGKLLTTLGGASVKINDFDAPIFYSFSGQLGVQIPFELEGQNSASVIVTVAGQNSEPRTIFLDSTAPGIFTLNQAGTGQGAVLIANSDILVAPAGSIPGRTSRPAQRGVDIITIFCTGLGTVSPALATGAPAGASQTPTAATVTIDGLPASVGYSGTAPGFVGLYQINATVPATSRIADNVFLVVSIGGKQSNPVTIAVGP
ncbi:MAG: hypothetical protein HY316_02640 [Acidobacteria bacterium]|nr:hypothetical protein [Acidobacteriota bacterium]